jgi:hypothetical protein
MVQLIARRAFRYANRRVQIGETFEASDKDARLLCAIRSATLVVEEAAPATPGEELAEVLSPPKKKRGRPRKERDESAPPKRKRGTYKRRDMEAE